MYKVIAMPEDKIIVLFETNDKKIAENLDIEKILKISSEFWDGGYAMAGLTGYGASFVVRDPAGIRPAHYYVDDETGMHLSPHFDYEADATQWKYNIENKVYEELQKELEETKNILNLS